MASLYEITGQFLGLQQIAEDPEIDIEVLKDTFDALYGELEYKADSCAIVIKNLEADVAKYKAEIERLTTRKRRAEESIKRIKSMIQQAMEIAGTKKLKGERFSFSIQKSAPAVVIDKEDEIPTEFIKVEYSVNKTDMKEWLKNNEADFAHLEASESIRIK